MKKPTWLSEHKYNDYSQTGEDGIIGKILEVIADIPVQTDRWCVEFGAADGYWLSNTRRLIDLRGYSAVLIEADRHKFRQLQKNSLQNDKVIALNQSVGFTKEDNLDRILAATPVPVDFDLLSIDIDGNDYHVWKAMQRYQPKVVVIEINPTIPAQIRFVQPADSSVSQGASLLSIVELAAQKGYELVSASILNAFFVRREYYPAFGIEDNAPDVLWTDQPLITHLFSAYDGTIFLAGSKKLPWHNLPLQESRMQYLPKCLRTYPENFTLLQKTAFRLYRLFRHPYWIK